MLLMISQTAEVEPTVFWLSAIFAIGLALIHLYSSKLRFLAMVHFVVNDYGLREDHKRTYRRIGRWILAATIIVGWVIGAATEVSNTAVAVLFSFLAGGVIFNVLKEELLEERKSRFWAFAVGVGICSALLLTL